MKEAWKLNVVRNKLHIGFGHNSYLTLTIAKIGYIKRFEDYMCQICTKLKHTLLSAAWECLRFE